MAALVLLCWLLLLRQALEFTLHMFKKRFCFKMTPHSLYVSTALFLNAVLCTLCLFLFKARYVMAVTLHLAETWLVTR